MNTELPGFETPSRDPEPEPAPKKGRGPSRKRQEQQRKGLTVAESDVQEVYQHWCLVMRPNRKNPKSLDLMGAERVRAAIADYGVEQCKLAIDGCAASPFHMGRNRQNKRYDTLSLIFRSHDHIDRFLGYLDDKNEDGEIEPW